MNFLGWVLILYFAITAAFVAGSVGKRWTPTTGGEAAVAVFINICLVVAIFVWYPR